jgi:redox-sensitive bicupin YhaK (pirin superfamily)
MDAGATWTLPPTAHPDAIRTLYLFRGESLAIEGERVDVKTGAVIANDRPLELVAGPAPVDILMLQGRPIAEPVVQYGPFVMNTRDEIQKAMLDYQRTRFGDWPWKNDAPVHARGEGRFAKHADGRIEKIER